MNYRVIPSKDRKSWAYVIGSNYPVECRKDGSRFESADAASAAAKEVCGTPGDGPMHYIRGLSMRVIGTWLQEFGYDNVAPTTAANRSQYALEYAMRERGLTRVARELNIHAKRLADRAYMQNGATHVTGRAAVIR